jgi:hypothetical protein
MQGIGLEFGLVDVGSGGEHEYAWKQGTKNLKHDAMPATMQPT